MFFNYLSQFLEPEAEIISYLDTPVVQTLSDKVQQLYLHSPTKSNYDQGYTEFSQIIAKRLIQIQYPLNYSHTNPFCPLCLRFIRKSDIFVACHLKQQRNYLIHQQCLLKNPSYELTNVGQLVENQQIIEEKDSNSPLKFQHGFDSRQFYVEISLSHPINQKNFFKINKKCTLIRDHLSIGLKQEESDNLFPNIVCLPLTDYHIEIHISELGNVDNKAKIKRYISLRNIKGDTKKSWLINCEGVKLQIEIVDKYEDKKQLSDKMNYNYRYPLSLPMPMLRIKHFIINLPEQFEQSDQGQYIIQSNSTIVEQLLNQKEDPQLSTIKSTDNDALDNSLRKKKVINSDFSPSDDQFRNDREKVNLQKLIKTKKLIEYVKCNTQSRIFQNYLNQACTQDIDKIILHISEHLPDLIMHQYGNYMTQKLFSVCSLSQRLTIMSSITQNISHIAKNKQGTHTLQAFIALFTSQHQFELMCQQLRADFYGMCSNSNATHFIQKVIKVFSIKHTLEFFHYTAQNLLAFALQKNAMCVIKHMMRKLKQLQQTEQCHNNVIQMIRRQFIINVTFGVDNLIGDSYGNYVIQFCYELFDLQKCAGITERILNKFVKYSIGKYASSVVFKCVSIYWTDRKILQGLKNILNYNNVVEVYRNKDGNKIFLEIMQKMQGTEVWNRLYSILVQIEPTRFYHDRWGSCLGSRSGQVGSKYTSFPEAKNKYSKKTRDQY